MSEYILCIDPGDMTGWATIELDGKGAPKEFENLTFEEFSGKISYLRQLDVVRPISIIYEEYRKRPGARHRTGNSYLATQVIGITRNFASEHRIKLIIQKPENKDTGAKWSGLQPPKRHAASHCYDAYNHGFYYLRNQGLIKTKLERSGSSGATDRA